MKIDALVLLTVVPPDVRACGNGDRLCPGGSTRRNAASIYSASGTTTIHNVDHDHTRAGATSTSKACVFIVVAYLNQPVSMSDSIPHVAVSNLIEIAFIVDKQEARVSLRKKRNQSLEDFFRDRLAILERKIYTLTTRPFHSVKGMPSLHNDTVAHIFESLIEIPYDHDDEAWPLPQAKQIGFVVLEAPRSGDMPPPACRGAKTQSSKITRTPSEVRCAIRMLSARFLLFQHDHCQFIVTRVHQVSVRGTAE